MERTRVRELLVNLLKIGGVVSIIILAPGAAPVIEKLFMKDKQFDKKEFKRTVNRLHSLGLIEKHVEGDKLTIKICEKGKQKAKEYILDELEIPKPAKWDKKWRIILFDIPESKRAQRKYFRYRLELLGFTLIQKSVYVHPYPCENEIRVLVDTYHIAPFVKYLLTDYFDGQDKLIERYK